MGCFFGEDFPKSWKIQFPGEGVTEKYQNF